MTTKIVLLGSKNSGKSDFITFIQSPLVLHDVKKQGDILVNSFDHIAIGQSSAKTFSFYSTADGDELEKSKADLHYYTSISDAVIYTVGYHTNETVEQFKARVDQEIAIHKPFDHADSHAVKILAITHFNSDLLSQEVAQQQKLKVESITLFAQLQGMDLIYISENNARDEFYNLIQKIADKITLHHFLSRLTGYFLFAIIQAGSSITIANPLASFFDVLERCRWNNLTNIGKNFVSVTLFPVWYPLFILVTSLFYNPGWLKGVSSSFEAASKKFQTELYDNRRNIIASIVIAGFITAAVLLTAGVFGPVVIGSVGLGALAVKAATVTAGFIGLNGVGTFGLTVIAGTVVGIASSLIYGVGYGLYRLVKSCNGAEPALASSSEPSASSNQPLFLREMPDNRSGPQAQPAYTDPYAPSYLHPVYTIPTVPRAGTPGVPVPAASHGHTLSNGDNVNLKPL